MCRVRFDVVVLKQDHQEPYNFAGVNDEKRIPAPVLPIMLKVNLIQSMTAHVFARIFTEVVMIELIQVV
ncbi:hypothetical protein D3C73_1275730 [compost metagenome]